MYCHTLYSRYPGNIVTVTRGPYSLLDDFSVCVCVCDDHNPWAAPRSWSNLSPLKAPHIHKHSNVRVMGERDREGPGWNRTTITKPPPPHDLWHQTWRWWVCIARTGWYILHLLRLLNCIGDWTSSRFVSDTDAFKTAPWDTRKYILHNANLLYEHVCCGCLSVCVVPDVYVSDVVNRNCGRWPCSLFLWWYTPYILVRDYMNSPDYKSDIENIQDSAAKKSDDWGTHNCFEGWISMLLGIYARKFTAYDKSIHKWHEGQDESTIFIPKNMT